MEKTGEVAVEEVGEVEGGEAGMYCMTENK